MDIFECIQTRYSYRGPYINTPVTGLIKKNGFGGKTPPAGICILTQRIPGYSDVIKGDIYFNIQDYAAAIENMLLAITSFGYASCWIEGHITENIETQKQIAKILNIPTEYIIVGFLPIGIPEKEGKRPSYKSFSERAWYNVYGNNK